MIKLTKDEFLKTRRAFTPNERQTGPDIITMHKDSPMAIVICAALDLAPSSEAEVARLKEALMPLAKEADDEGRERDPDSVRVFIKLGDLRRARAALQPKEES